ncbi:MAG: BTAD domain-containing putative transcriptional regulator [Gemmatimonadota bacterium]
MWRFSTFSGLRISRDGSLLAPLPAQRGALLSILAAANERGVARGRLLILLWPESTEQRARHNLSQAIYATNRELGDEVIETTGAEVRLAPAIATDVAEFLSAVAAGDHAQAVRHYTGPFLDGFILPDAPEFEEWLSSERRRFERAASSALERLAANADPRTAAEHWRRLATIEPLASRYAIGLAGAVAAAGDPGAAMQILRDHSQLLHRETGAATPEGVTRLMEELATRPVPAGTPPSLAYMAAGDDGAVASSAAATAEGLSSVQESSRTPVTHSEPRGGWRLLLVGVVLVCVVIGAALWRRDRAPSAVSTGSMVVLADVHDLTPGATLGTALGVAASVALQQSAHFEVRARAGLTGALQRMERSPADSFPEPIAIELAQRDGGRAVISMSVASLGPGYLLAVHVVDAATGQRTSARQLTVDSAAELLDGVDQLMSWVRREMGDRAWRAAQPLPRVTTSSMEALRAYADAQTAFNTGEYERVGASIARALAADTGFAAAYALRGRFLIVNNKVREGLAALREASLRTDRITSRERLEVQLALATSEGRREDAVDVAAALASQFPSRETWWRYGEALRYAQLLPRSIAALQRSIELDSTFARAHHSLALALRERGDSRAAIAAYARTWQNDSALLLRDFFNQQWGSTFVDVGEYAQAESVFRKMLVQSEVNSQQRGFRALAYLALFRGRYREATGFLEEALSRYRGPSLSAFRDQLLLADARWSQGERAKAHQALDHALAIFRKLELEAGFLALATHQLISAGRLSNASEVIDVLRRRAALRPDHVNDQAALRIALADLALARGQPQPALEELADRNLGALQGMGEYIRVKALARLSRIDSAIVVARAIVDGDVPFGTESQQDVFRTMATLGDLALIRGDTGLARQAWTGLLRRWPEGDVDLPILANARRSVRGLDSPLLGVGDTARRRITSRP